MSFGVMKARTLGLVLSVVLGSNAFAQSDVSVSTSPRGRGWLTGLGVGLVGGGLAAIAVGAAFAANASQADSMISGLLDANGDLPKNQAPAAGQLSERRASAQMAAIGLLVTGGALVVGGVISVIVDSMFAHAPRVAFALVREGGVLVVGGEF